VVDRAPVTSKIRLVTSNATSVARALTAATQTSCSPGLLLVLRGVAGHVAHLRQRVVEAGALGSDRQLLVVVKAPVGALVNGAGNQPTADVGHPVGELQRLCRAVFGHN
jgi:hypothetical protein